MTKIQKDCLDPKYELRNWIRELIDESLEAGLSQEEIEEELKVLAKEVPKKE